MATLNKNTAWLIVMSVSGAILALSSVSDTWPLWAQGAVIALLIVAFPLLNALGVLEAIGLKDVPGSRFKARYMFTGLALFVGALLWVWTLVRVVPDSIIGVVILFVPALVASVAAVLLFIKGTFGR
jgi:hypothetical protein